MKRAAPNRWSQGDPSGFLQISAPDVVYFDPTLERRLDGLLALTALYERVRGKIHTDRYELLNPKVQLCGDAAVLTWQVWLVVVLGANANQVHKWAHRTPAENGPVIGLLQRLRLVQTPRHHARHHTDPKNSHYCVLTNFLNPVLDGLRLWQGLEAVVWAVFGVRRRIDTSVSMDKQPRPAQVGCRISRA